MDNDILSFFYRWHRFEKQNGVSVIDFDLPQRGKEFPGGFKSREEIQSELCRIIDLYKTSQGSDPRIHAKLIASKYFLRALMGERIPFPEYVEHTMGVKPARIAEEVLVEFRQRADKALQAIGYRYSPGGLRKFAKDQKLSQEEIRHDFITYLDRILPEMVVWLGLKGLKLSYALTFVKEDVYWQNWISMVDSGKIVLRYNLHPRHECLRGQPEFLVLHELCAHALQALSWQREIQLGRMSPVLGLLTVFGPEQFLLEGIAETIAHFYPRQLYSSHGKIVLYREHLYWFVWNNAHIMANEGADEKKIIGYIQSYLPILTEEVIRKDIRVKTQDPLGRTYQYIYGISQYYHWKLAEHMTSEERRAYIRDAYIVPRNPTMIANKCGISLP